LFLWKQPFSLVMICFALFCHTRLFFNGQIIWQRASPCCSTWRSQCLVNLIFWKNACCVTTMHWIKLWKFHNDATQLALVDKIFQIGQTCCWSVQTDHSVSASSSGDNWEWMRIQLVTRTQRSNWQQLPSLASKEVCWDTVSTESWFQTLRDWPWGTGHESLSLESGQSHSKKFSMGFLPQFLPRILTADYWTTSTAESAVEKRD